ncbi:tRNA uridine-5-carboxymethylaminomethyl(34) synthesis GTPase MnmE [Synechocystis salina LEGE 06099]|uniref:tRNA uridine-5-carboxymethylaminomethyl(34) synthesis GTPase MnmE n=1 Tax=Synechocystis salina TaxID=945780 RepID=UPI001881FE85|nr:tRNA uridine-5-carboxymethylaminomethyl(34) synthesis GTPase MnmE [Synechocystis salina]MBE9203537.1 tRNA uridine-5-carboxymethylaminomethyl(34) synthesis GTPase MnmE [Synechocystis salina LEGE 06099]
MHLEDTIAAIATAIVPQQGSIGVVRLSGPQSLTIAKTLFEAPGSQTWESHRILYGHVRHPDTKLAIDEALLLLMLAPRSYTKEDVVEFQCHGGIMPVQQVLQLCLQQGARLAHPGEFSLRAFLNGRLDLTQAESISELVGAQSPEAAAIALAGLQGKLAQPIRELRNTCLDILAEVEARIDFEDDLPPLDEDLIRQQLENLYCQLEKILNTAQRGELLRTGLKVAIVGQPNVGKSSLLNAWSRTDRAIVTDLPGTTRDVVESQLVVEGIPIQVLDTAGIRETADQVEQMGVERSRKAAQQADFVLLTVDAHQGWTEADQLIYDQVKDRLLILVINKIDLARADLVNYPPEITNIVLTAAAVNLGIEALENAIVEQVNQNNLSPQNLDFAINQRQAAVLTEAQLALKQLQQTLTEQLPLDFWTIDLRLAINALGRVTGETVTESVLDRIFSRFCIGK